MDPIVDICKRFSTWLRDRHICFVETDGSSRWHGAPSHLIISSPPAAPFTRGVAVLFHRRTPSAGQARWLELAHVNDWRVIIAASLEEAVMEIARLGYLL